MLIYLHGVRLTTAYVSFTFNLCNHLNITKQTLHSSSDQLLCFPKFSYFGLLEHIKHAKHAFNNRANYSTDANARHIHITTCFIRQ